METTVSADSNPLFVTDGTTDAPPPGSVYSGDPTATITNVGAASGGSWDQVWQTLATKGLSAAIDNQFIQPFQLAHDKALATDPFGNLYLRGTPTTGITKPAAPGQLVGNMSTLMPWIVGAAIVAGIVFALK